MKLKTLESNSQSSVAVVVLAFSRLDTLRELIDSLKRQTRPLNEIIVVFQGKDEKILTWLRSQIGLTIHQQENRGSAGGFSTGIQLSISHGHDWTWIIDDDAIPDLDALEYLVSCKYFDSQNTGFLSSRIVDSHRCTYMSPVPCDANTWYGTVLEDGCVPVQKSTWLGLLVATPSVLECGLPIEEYFLWEEDGEFSMRIARAKKSYCVIRSVIVHYQNKKFDPFNSTDSIKYYYMVRNRIATIKLSDRSAFYKVFKIGISICKVLRDIIMKKAPIKSIKALYVGIFLFWPKIKFIS